MKRSLIALAVAGSVSPAIASQQSESAGFVEDSHLTLTNRNYYLNHDFKAGARDGRDWSHALLGNFESGFTQGAVGFGLDVCAYYVQKLDGYGAGTGNLAVDADGHTESFGHIGGAAKLRISNTVLKYGILQPSAPVFAAGGWNILPQTAQGFQLRSSEIDDLELDAGHFTASSASGSSSNHGPILANYAVVETPSADYLGGTYKVSDALTVALYGAEFEDLWRQYYGNVNLVLPLAEAQSLGFDFHLYRTLDRGQALAGDINNTAWSLATAYTVGAHTITLAYQQVQGDEPFDYVGFGRQNSGGDSIALANSVLVSDFNGPGEKSLQLRYALDMADYGVPGLTFMARYVYGRDVDGSHADPNGAYAGLYGRNDKERETNLEIGYVVQEGAAKDLAIHLEQGWHRGDASLNGDTNQLRLTFEYPLSLL